MQSSIAYSYFNNGVGKMYFDKSNQSISSKVAHVKSANQDRKHHCHWPNCTAQVPPAKWGCSQHWYLLPKYFRNLIWETCQIGQEITQNPSISYLKVAYEVQEWIRANYPKG
jgi:hypothetical protein